MQSCWTEPEKSCERLSYEAAFIIIVARRPAANGADSRDLGGQDLGGHGAKEQSRLCGQALEVSGEGTGFRLMSARLSAHLRSCRHIWKGGTRI